MATFHKRNQDTNSFRTGQQFLIKLDLKPVNSEPFKGPMSLILPRRMIQGHQKSRQSDPATAVTSADAGSATSPSSSNQDAVGQNQSQDTPAPLTGDPDSHFYLEVAVHLTSTESPIEACPECRHKVRRRTIRKKKKKKAPLPPLVTTSTSVRAQGFPHTDARAFNTYRRAKQESHPLAQVRQRCMDQGTVLIKAKFFSSVYRIML